MRHGLFIGAFVASCGFTHGALPDGNQPPNVDANGDGGMAADGAGCASWPQIPTGIDPCVVPAPEGDLNLCTPVDYLYSTTDGTIPGADDPASVLDNSTTPPRRIVSVNQLIICAGTNLTVIGSPSLVFVVHGSARIEGTIDVSAWIDIASFWHAGPGAGDCASGFGAVGANSGNGAGGGGGGGYGSAGGNGGLGDQQATGAAGGMSNGSPSLLPLRGGCRGGAGGAGDNSSFGRAGLGGGAIQIAAHGAIGVAGTIRASGGPGLGGKGADCGGGGGGAGGGILLEADEITIGTGAALCANGGGGGGGANDGGPLNVGGDGAIGTCALTAAAAGAGGTSNGRPGGAGGYGVVAAENGMGADEGGGGGGGAVGRIRVRSKMPATIGGTITPPFL